MMFEVTQKQTKAPLATWKPSLNDRSGYAEVPEKDVAVSGLDFEGNGKHVRLPRKTWKNVGRPVGGMWRGVGQLLL